jgi:hypothetical protein
VRGHSADHITSCVGADDSPFSATTLAITTRTSVSLVSLSTLARTDPFPPIPSSLYLLFTVVSFADIRATLSSYASFTDGATAPDCSIRTPQTLSEDKENHLFYTYSIGFVPSDIPWGFRWDNYLHVFDPKIHWFSLVNSVGHYIAAGRAEN